MTVYRLLVALVFSILATAVIADRLSADDSGVASGDVSSEGRVDESPPKRGASDETAEAVAVQSQQPAGQAATSPTETTPPETSQPKETGSKQPNSEVVAALQAGPKALSLAFRMAAKRATPSVVVLYTYGQSEEADGDEETADAPGQLPLLKKADEAPVPKEFERPTGLGSGVIISADGLIITNNHVIKNAKRVVVQLPDESRVDADVFRGDPDSDVGMVRIKTDESLTPIEIGDSDTLDIGDWVLAIGSPFRLEATVSAGIISGKNRRIERIKRSSMLQTDAAINPGNSGGALIDLDGRVIGISTAIATRTGFYQGVGFAIPINQAQWIASELDRHGGVRRAAIGATLAELNPRIARKFKLEPYSGVLVYQVIKDSVAEQAGIQPLDVIVEFAGETVRDSNSLQEAIERRPIGSKQPIIVRRKGERVTLSVELATIDNPLGESSEDEPKKQETDDADAEEAEGGSDEAASEDSKPGDDENAGS